MKNKNILFLLLVLTANIPLHTADKTTGATAPSRLSRLYAAATTMLPAWLAPTPAPKPAPAPAWLTTAPAPAPVVTARTTPKPTPAPIHSAPAPQPSSAAVAAPAPSSAAAPIASTHKRKPAEATATAAPVIELLDSDDSASKPAPRKRRNTSAPAAIILVSDDEDDATSAAAAASDTATLKIRKIPCLQQGETNHCGFYGTFFATMIAKQLQEDRHFDTEKVTSLVNNRALFNSFIDRLFETLGVTTGMGEYLSAAYNKDNIEKSTCINDDGIQVIIHANGYSRDATSCTNINTTDIINLYLIQDQREPEKNRKPLHAKFEQMLTSLRTVQFNPEKPRARERSLKKTTPYIHKTDVLNYRCMIMTANLHTICLFVDRTTSTMYYLDSLDNYFDYNPDFIPALSYLLSRILE